MTTQATIETDTYDDMDDDYYTGCECELDFNCGCGRYGGATVLEVRYAADAEEDAAYERSLGLVDYWEDRYGPGGEW